MTLIAATMVHTKEKTPFDILYKTHYFLFTIFDDGLKKFNLDRKAAC